MTDPDVLLAKIVANQEHTTTTLADLRDDLRESERKTDEHRSAIHSRVNEIKTDVTTVVTKLDSHLTEDDRRFSIVWRVLFGAGATAATIAGGLEVIK